MTEEVRKKFEEHVLRTKPGTIRRDFVLVDGAYRFPDLNAELEAFAAAYQLGVEAMREAAAELLEALANQWVGTLPSDEVASLNCKQYAKAIRNLKG